MAVTGTTSLSGVLSGIDSEVFVTQALAVARKPLDNLLAQKALTQNRQVTFDNLQNLFTSLKSQADSLRDMAAIRGVTASTSDLDIVALTASVGALEGSYGIEINQLAAAERRVHAGVADKTAALGSAAQFVYTYDGTTRTIQTSDTTTLEDLAGLINDDSSNPGVSASILEYDSGDGLAYHLVLGGRNTGVDYTITIEAGTTLTGFEAGGNWTVSQAARNAQVRLDGYPAGGWIESESNSVSGVIPNVTLELKQIGSATVTLSRDTSQVASGLSTLVSTYNAIVDNLDSIAGYDDQTKTGGIFQGDSTVTGLISGARDLLVRVASGFVNGTDPYTTPASIGLELDKDGQLALDSAKLNEALGADYDAVLSLIAASGSGTVSSSDIQFTSALDSTTPGSYQIQLIYDGAGIITEAYFRKNDALDDWRAAEVDGNSITGALGSPEQGLNILVITPYPSETKTYDIEVKQGFAGALYDTTAAQLDPVSGTFEVKSSQFDLAISSLDKQIELQQARLTAKEERLRAQYIRMETALAKLEGFRSAFTAMISSLESMNNSNN
ncbi:MAG: flagellar filament capping protein FliD [Phycisphaerae bacterium]|nr:flagellar filament capping protein FliD [Phycisphaerae bacterium]